MDQLADYHETHPAKRRCIENPWMSPGISPSAGQIGDADWYFPPHNNVDMSEDLDMPSFGGVDFMLSTEPPMNEMQTEPSLNPIEDSVGLGPPLPDFWDVENDSLTPVSGYSGSCLPDEKTPATTACLEDDSQDSQTISPGIYDVCFGMVSSISGALGE